MARSFSDVAGRLPFAVTVFSLCALFGGGPAGAAEALPSPLQESVDGVATPECAEGEGCERPRPPLESVRFFFNGRSLAKICRGQETERIACQIYLAGIHDANEVSNWQHNEDAAWCGVVGVSASQMRQIFLRYVDAHPEHLHRPAAWVVAKMLTEVFPCEAAN